MRRTRTLKLIHQRILATLETIAAAGQPCPTNAAIAEAIGSDPKDVGAALKEMRETGLILVETARRARNVTIVATGARTAVTTGGLGQ